MPTPKNPNPCKRGRPTDYVPVVVDEICRRLADGESLIAICKGKWMPDRQTVRVWLGKYSEFRSQYARAREDQADALVDEGVEAAREAKDSQSAACARVKVDAFFRLAGKLKPKVYGDKLDFGGTVEHRHEVRPMLARLARDPAAYANAKAMAERLSEPAGMPGANGNGHHSGNGHANGNGNGNGSN